jgi:hypothetical protein
VDDITRGEKLPFFVAGTDEKISRLGVKRIGAIEKSVEPAGVDEDGLHRIASAHARSCGLRSLAGRGWYLPAKPSSGCRDWWADLFRTRANPSLTKSERLRDVRADSCLAARYCHSSNWTWVFIMMA